MTTTAQVLEAGRDLDALIALRVDGWKPSVFSNFPWQLTPPDGDETVVRNVPNYSTDRDAACALLDRYVGGWEAKRVNGFVLVRVWPHRLNVSYEGIADTVALAICRAALSAADGSTAT
jgi:hypothetical protein